MKALVAALCVTLLLAGCSSVNMAQRQTEDGQAQTVLHTNNSLLAGRLTVKNLKTRRQGNLMQVQATLENQWQFQLDFQYKFKWFDKDGFEISPQGQPWRQVVMAGDSQANVQAVAPNPSAVRFEIWVQE